MRRFRNLNLPRMMTGGWGLDDGYSNVVRTEGGRNIPSNICLVIGTAILQVDYGPKTHKGEVKCSNSFPEF